MRRKQQTELVRDFYRKSKNEQLNHLYQNGITQKDLDANYDKGFEQGYKLAGTDAIESIYAGCAKVLADAGNSKDEVLAFLKQVDDFVMASLGGKEDLEQLLHEYGIQLVFKDTLERVQEV